MILDEFLKSNDKTKDLHLLKAEFDNTTQKLNLWLNYPENVEYNDEQTKEVQKIIGDFLEMPQEKICFHFKHALLDIAQCKTIVQNYIKSNYPSVAMLCDFENIELSKGEKNKLTLPLDNEVFSRVSQEELASLLASELQENLLVDVEVEFRQIQKTMDLQQLLSTDDSHLEELAILRSTQGPTFQEYDIFQSNAIFGEITEKQARRLDCIGSGEGEVVIAGKVAFAKKTNYVPKNVKEGTEPTEKVRLNFSVQDYWGDINCVYFPTKLTQDKLDDITDGLEVIVKGEKNEFNGRISIRVKAIAVAVLQPKPEEQVIENKPFDKYLVVEPQEFHTQHQMNLLQQERVLPPYIMENTFVVYDFETTGLSPDTCQVIEIGAVKIKNGKICELFSTFINCPTPLPPIITEITNITDEMLKDAPPFELAFADFYKFCQGCIILGYNNIDFDSRFYKNALRKIGFPYNFEEIDVFKIAPSKLRLKNYKLCSVVEALGIELINAHRAYADATATAEVFLKLQD